MVTLSDILNENYLRQLAGDRFFQRGVSYFKGGAVRSLVQYGDRIAADVVGTETYQVQLWLDDQDLQSRCTCPLGVDGYFCKHCVAVGLTWLETPPPIQPAENAPAKSGTTMEDLQQYLLEQSKETLAEMILNQAMNDSCWRTTLLMKVATQQLSGVDINTFRRSLRNAIAVDGFIEYDEVNNYISHIEAVLEGIANLIDEGHGEDARSLCEEAVALLEESVNSVEDYDNELTYIIGCLEDLHFQACQEANIDSRIIAERVFYLEYNSQFGFFYNAIDKYAELLDEAGKATYQRCIEIELETLAQAGQDGDRYASRTLRSMGERLVSKTGTVAELVQVLSQNLSTAADYLRIAQLYYDHRNINQALDWAEKGFAVPQSRISDKQRLVELLIKGYNQTSRFEDAVEMALELFAIAPMLEHYQLLKQQADQVDAWDTWRPKALENVQQLIDHDSIKFKQNLTPHTYKVVHPWTSLLVEIFLWEGNIDQAWKLARRGNCKLDLQMQVVDLRGKTHPEEVIPVYQATIAPLIDQTHNDAYRQAIELVCKIKDIMERLNRQAEFADWLADLKQTYKRKRNFIKFLQQDKRLATTR